MAESQSPVLLCTADGLGGGEDCGYRRQDPRYDLPMTEKLIGEIFSTRGQGTQVDIKSIDEYGIPWVGM